ncbi:MAG: large-conductance mechanosensitive channel protein MscL [Clostridia bacterium]|nr:large-conductance mechanosensitive channel protein MscL [Clostridia bacterium]
MKKFMDEFKAFAMRGNVVDMAIGVIIGGAFGKITTSLVNDIFMPILGLLTGGVNFGGLFYALDGNQYASIEAAAETGVGTINYGAFVQYIIDFILVAFCMFLVIKFMNKMKKPEPAPAPAKEPRLCPFCRTEIADDATRCPHCTSMLDK